MNQQADESRLRLHGADRRGQMYAQIADVHNSICQAKWMAQSAGKQVAFSAGDILKLVLHLDKSVAFLAEDLLTLQSANDARLTALEGIHEELLDSAEALEKPKE